jgi:hypothetical protein
VLTWSEPLPAVPPGWRIAIELESGPPPLQVLVHVYYGVDRYRTTRERCRVQGLTGVGRLVGQVLNVGGVSNSI